MTRLVVRSGRALRGCIRVPGDKSISHRALLLGALADGPSHYSGFPASGDCQATLECLRALGVHVEESGEGSLAVHGQGLRGLQAPTGPLNCQRSGTTMRLLAGIMAGQRFAVTLTGSSQLLRRPMRRITDPLQQMGAEIESSAGHGPLTIRGRPLQGRVHHLSIASAQVKSALLLAGLYADGPTIVRQPGPARDHTERMLATMGAAIRTSGLTVTIKPSPVLRPVSLRIPGDVSSAAFALVAAILAPRSELTIQGVGVNPTRTGLLEILAEMGAKVHLEQCRVVADEPVADLTVRTADLRAISVRGDRVVRMIDELPVLAVAATQARGTTVVRDAAELRVKETDRIATVVLELRALGAQIEPLEDGFVVTGPTSLRGAHVDSHGDHRLAMALSVAGLIAQGEVVVKNVQCIDDSFPGFVKWMREIGADYG